MAKENRLVWVFEARTGIVYVDELNFGTTVTHLIVSPNGNDRKPVLSILESTGRPSVCLAAGFFPKTGQMTLMNQKDENHQLPVEQAPLSSSKTYFFVGLSRDGESIKTCSLNDAKVEQVIPNVTDEVNDKNIPEKIQVKVCEKQPTDRNVTRIDSKHNDPKVNFMSLVVNFLRILFAKTVTFNMLMTVKAVVF
ncbi:hypothetical protein SKAU_G00200880 [Synaphobranchus kaupii]|uniref:Uncharacterized protein n=1 Tax=Synaphobranchus kaupii TaxID=118154 RepID=A0A9Q1IXA1_SYNKA|nr:hypothetical protein SKAU_G00200880 [Synaphobranchus kaupii]